MGRKNKYNAEKITIDGHDFPSKKEAERYCEFGRNDPCNSRRDGFGY